MPAPKCEQKIVDGVSASLSLCSIKDAALSQRGGKDKIMHAIVDTQQAIETVSGLCEDLLISTGQRYYQGNEPGLDADLVDAMSQLRDSSSIIHALANTFQVRRKGAPVYKVPSEIMFIIFGYLNSDELLASTAVCQVWRNVLVSNAAREGIWNKSSAMLEGWTVDIHSRWNTLKKFAPMPTSLTLSILDPEPDGSSLYHFEGRSSLATSFPSSNLREFYLRLKHPWEEEAWNLVIRCPNLKVLHWRVDRKGSAEENWNSKAQCSVRQEFPLASSRLDEFYLSDYGKVNVGSEFIRMLSQVKRLYINHGLNQDDLLAIITTANDHIEDMTVRMVPGWRGGVPQVIASSVHLSKLRIASFYGSNLYAFSITAPNVEIARFKEDASIDWALLDSCRDNLKRLEIEENSYNCDKRLAQELFNMPHLECLSVTFGPEARKGASLAALWQAITTRSTNKEGVVMQDVLPSLKKLRIVRDRLLGPEIILKFFEVRRLLHMTPLETMQVEMEDILSDDDVASLEDIERTIPAFSHEFYDSENSSSSEWEGSDASARSAFLEQNTA